MKTRITELFGIKDIPSVADLINRIVTEAENILRNAKERYGLI